MTEGGSRVSSSDDATSNSTDALQPRQRKKKRWDQPAESFVSAGMATVVPGVSVPFANMGSLAGISLPGIVAPVSGAFLTNNELVANSLNIPATFQEPSIPQINASAMPKANQPKVQDDLIIAREIVINDAESSVRYKLTKRQTQEEIQKCTGAVVITRGKYRPPSAPPDGEKPLYLHISSGAHLKDTAERILSVDRAAALVEEMLKQGPNLLPSFPLLPVTNGSGVKALSTCVFLGFDADESLNIAARIRGPNDQYINHIMNETGATVVLRGRGSGNSEITNTGEAQQPLHLFLSANNPKSLDDAKRLAENLLDTISLECGASRVSSNKAYKAVPPPQNLLAGIQSSGTEQKANTGPGSGSSLPSISSTLLTAASSAAMHGATPVYSQGTMYQPSGLVNCGLRQPTLVGHPQPLVNAGTSYSGYCGIYPQATPLQQVALALSQSTSPIISTIAPTTSFASTTPEPCTSSSPETEKRPARRRKFQELLVDSKDSAKSHQASESLKPRQASANGVRNLSTIPAPKNLVQSSSNGMPPPPPRTMPMSPSVNGMPPRKTLSPLPSSNDMPPPPPRTMLPPPLPPKSSSLSALEKPHEKDTVSNKSKSTAVPVVSDTLVKLMEYGDEDDDPEDSEESDSGNS